MQKLELADLPKHEIEGAGWKYGVPASEIKRLVAHWLNSYSWRSQEAILNKLPHFKTKIDVDGFGELGIHFVHQVSENPNAIPLFTHGWPGSFLEATRMLESLKGIVEYSPICMSNPETRSKGPRNLQVQPTVAKAGQLLTPPLPITATGKPYYGVGQVRP
ncbi:epoxide hydrolase N terminus-domain-containing protein [Leptodontidium sp. MPI-SDFR-AT-0119]|nr:epoxide hydrolase N terminus-domain-containing protein [Leptodontidium sp. MPI-SDFR-AT-0119]